MQLVHNILSGLEFSVCIAYMDDNIPETQFENFMIKLEGYIDMYLDRNAPDASFEERQVYSTRMLDSHLHHYAKKLGIDLPSRV